MRSKPYSCFYCGYEATSQSFFSWVKTVKTKNWFEVDKNGLAQIQGDKPKTYILRELIQNAWDEEITECEVTLEVEAGKIKATVTDDSPEGFRDLTDSFTLFKETYKRSEPTKRGRFNLGEKQAIARCIYAHIETTKGGVVFDKNGRHTKRAKRAKGSLVEVLFQASKSDFDEILSAVKNYLPPKHIRFIVNGEQILSREPIKVISATLMTENNEAGIFKRTTRKTDIHVHRANRTVYLYEMGLPVTTIECKYSVDIQQKVPLSVDRETVPEAYLKDVYAEVLNATANELQGNEASETWVRLGSEDERVQKEALKQVIQKRYGDNVVVANPFDKVSIDDAIAHGYKTIYGSEMSRDEWSRIKEFGLIRSSSDVFSHEFVSSTPYEPNADMVKVSELAKRIAQTFLHVTIGTTFLKSPQATIGASYNPTVKVLTFNVSRLGVDFFNPPINERVINLIIHELGHENGMHTESSYHETITELAGKLVMTALREPKFFEGSENSIA
jgi:hypothetical protein